jgi:hypothetical protein
LTRSQRRRGTGTLTLPAVPSRVVHIDNRGSGLSPGCNGLVTDNTTRV